MDWLSMTFSLVYSPSSSSSSSVLLWMLVHLHVLGSSKLEAFHALTAARGIIPVPRTTTAGTKRYNTRTFSTPSLTTRENSVRLFALFDGHDNHDDDDFHTYGIGVRYIPIDEPTEVTCDPDFPCDNDELFQFPDGGTVIIFGVPLIVPIVSFFTFNQCAKIWSDMYDAISSNNWVAVDGGAYQARIIAPAINGIVMPAVALLFATLTSTTITTLRQRQTDIRNAINMEAGELRAIECLLDSIDEGVVQDQCRDYLIQYTSRILAECHKRVGAGNDVINPRRGFDSELNGFTRQLNQAYGTVIPSHVAAECYASVARLREQRVLRITALQSVYPLSHYAILFVLAMAVCVAFLMETDQELLVFLNAGQLKILWSMLTGTFVALFAVVADLLSPFSGLYQISASVDQLHIIKMTLQASRRHDKKTEGVNGRNASSASKKFARSKTGQQETSFQ
jgi:hypothetical protein